MSNRTFGLALFGFSDTERRVMTSVLRLAAARGRKYRLHDGEGRAEADIAIVDMDSPAALREWQQTLRDGAPLPALRVMADPSVLNSDQTGICRPITVKRLLEGLDAIAIRHYRYVPELTIRDDGNPEALTGTALASAARAARGVTRTGVRALVVDDSAPVRKLMGIELGLFGIDVDFAATGEAALERLQEHSYDIVFLDLTLPGIDGHAVCKAIRRNRDLKGLRVVMLTGRDSRIDRIRGAMAGCSAYLTKPVGQEELHRILEQLLPKEELHGHHQSAGG
ncbi:twitching motility two-component system response regulator PilG [Natronocella acetinitrilica]|uniref:Twitching motility two-component system response regulator PilG n=1 Tax=Natronocella acetinitrilica TaxID=414046 RepID=A0AAE3G402_9GAMM|nr:response regulator [Natronocella acetinitrilica]MCP1675234.1 twitching motility two-component system response regulator PilG [Natronocella acetinitrilica]